MPDSTKPTIGSRLHELRERHGFTQREIAEKLGGLTISALSQYESNKRKPKNETLIKLAEIYNTSTDFILCTTDYPGAKQQKYDFRAKKDFKIISTKTNEYQTHQTQALKEDIDDILIILKSMSEKKQQQIIPLLRNLLLTFKRSHEDQP